MSDTAVIIAISIIIIGFLILAGLAVWLAVDRQRRSQEAAGQPGGNVLAERQKTAGERRAAAQSPASAAQPAAPARPETPASQGSAAGAQAAGTPQTPNSSGEYPSASLYDQTLLPEPPRRRSRKAH